MEKTHTHTAKCVTGQSIFTEQVGIAADQRVEDKKKDSLLELLSAQSNTVFEFLCLLHCFIEAGSRGM